MRSGTRFRVERPTVNDWLTCPDVAVWYEVLAVGEAIQAWQSGRQAAKDVTATITAGTAHLRG